MSIIKNIINPLSDYGVFVDVYGTVPMCAGVDVRRQKLLEWLNTSRARHIYLERIESHGIAETYMLAYKMLIHVHNLYDYIFVTRHDTNWTFSVKDFSFSNINRISFPPLNLRCADSDTKRVYSTSISILERIISRVPECDAETDDAYLWMPSAVLPILYTILKGIMRSSNDCVFTSVYTHNFVRICFDTIMSRPQECDVLKTYMRNHNQARFDCGFFQFRNQPYIYARDM